MSRNPKPEIAGNRFENVKKRSRNGGRSAARSRRRVDAINTAGTTEDGHGVDGTTGIRSKRGVRRPYTFTRTVRNTAGAGVIFDGHRDVV